MALTVVYKCNYPDCKWRNVSLGAAIQHEAIHPGYTHPGYTDTEMVTVDTTKPNKRY